jgi:hypothetical protein
MDCGQFSYITKLGKNKNKNKKTQLIYALSTYLLVIYSLTEITGIRNEH